MEVQWCIHQGREGFSGQSRGKQCSFINLSALLTAQTIPVIEWNSTTIDNVLGQGDNMYFNAFNNDLISREGFLSLNNLPLPTVLCCRQVLRLFMSTGLFRHLRFSFRRLVFHAFLCRHRQV